MSKFGSLHFALKSAKNAKICNSKFCTYFYPLYLKTNVYLTLNYFTALLKNIMQMQQVLNPAYEI